MSVRTKFIQPLLTSPYQGEEHYTIPLLTKEGTQGRLKYYKNNFRFYLTDLMGSMDKCIQIPQ